MLYAPPGMASCARLGAALLTVGAVTAQAPELSVGELAVGLKLDGRLDEAAWQKAPVIDGLTQVEPVEGARAAFATRVRVLADRTQLVFGIECDDPEPDRIVSHSVARDVSLDGEDHVRLVLGTFQDGRTGYVFAVNPSEARYDAVVADRGEDEDARWDGIWEARCARGPGGWSCEIRLPVQTLAFRRGLDAWHFNVQRRVQRTLEVSRWASPNLNTKLPQTSRAGLLAGLPAFTQGLGLSITPYALGSLSRAEYGLDREFDADAGLDVAWRITPDLLATVTLNTDFADTEVDARRTNLTRFPQFFPEKRRFFLEGGDAFDFGLGLSEEVRPFHSRRIGLVSGREVPLLWGGKLVGRVAETSVGALVAHTDDAIGVAPDSTMGVVRVRQDVLSESSVGLIATSGDPLGRDDSWSAGTDFTYQTSELFGDQNFLAGVWGLGMDRDGAGDDRFAWGWKIDYPNDLWDIALIFREIGAGFDPSLGFVRRTDVRDYTAKAEFAPRPDSEIVRRHFHEASVRYVTDRADRWESYRAVLTPLGLRFESGDSAEVGVRAEGERLDADFEIADGVVIPRGEYEWVRGEVQFDTAAKRWIRGDATYAFGPFYEGHLHTVELGMTLRPHPLWTLGLAAELNRADLPQGDFKEDVYLLQVDFNASSDLVVRSLLQYDTDSRLLGTNTRLQWTVTPEQEIACVINYNAVREDGLHKRSESDAVVVKAQHTFRF